MKNRALQVIAPETEIYGNWKVYSPDDQLMMRCSTKKANWYLSRNLAEKIGELTIKINFKPNGMGHATDYHGYYLEEKNAICVCCGSDKDLTRHHVVPYCYRRYFPDLYKDHSSFDVVLLCEDCHSTYETHSIKLQNEIAARYGYQLDPIIQQQNKDVANAGSALNALLQYRAQIPLERQQYLYSLLSGYFKRPITVDDLETIEVERQLSQKDRTAYVMSQVTDEHSFIIEWRKHFIKFANPQHLSKSWLDHYETVVR